MAANHSTGLHACAGRMFSPLGLIPALTTAGSRTSSASTTFPATWNSHARISWSKTSKSGSGEWSRWANQSQSFGPQHFGCPRCGTRHHTLRCACCTEIQSVCSLRCKMRARVRYRHMQSDLSVSTCLWHMLERSTLALGIARREPLPYSQAVIACPAFMLAHVCRSSTCLWRPSSAWVACGS